MEISKLKEEVEAKRVITSFITNNDRAKALTHLHFSLVRLEAAQEGFTKVHLTFDMDHIQYLLQELYHAGISQGVKEATKELRS